ncbi:DNA cytosine methyltransferase [Paenarthrobacter sp. YIM B13468]|uniref:DNA cytosine methyltransferase n=1 Tax=Paenarthrobacter sp. YIM B13468 TaxID=3366295 RepID=UPI0036717869
MRSVELFAGAGGLALGCELAGFKSIRTVEWDKWACDTIRENKANNYSLVRNWNVVESDVRNVDWSDIGDIDLVAGGPPCQPFSMGGKARAADDKRDMFPAAIDVIRKLRPRAFILENVRGLTRSAFSNYFSYIQLRLAHPLITARDGEIWSDHYARLQAEHTSGHSDELEYHVIPTLVNAADYGVPQQRHRVFLVGFRADQQAEWSFPAPTHSYDSLLHSQWISGSYWERHKVPPIKRPVLSDRDNRRVKILGELQTADTDLLAWQTVRDALVGLEEPAANGSKKHLNHVLQSGAKSYPGHTGSPLDLPAKTLKAGGHGVPGGENMLRRIDGSVRYFTIRESARLQTFPDRYELHGSWGEAMRQLGNAVPVRLGQIVAASVAEHLLKAGFRSQADAHILRELSAI